MLVEKFGLPKASIPAIVLLLMEIFRHVGAFLLVKILTLLEILTRKISPAYAALIPEILSLLEILAARLFVPVEILTLKDLLLRKVSRATAVLIQWRLQLLEVLTARLFMPVEILLPAEDLSAELSMLKIASRFLAKQFLHGLN